MKKFAIVKPGQFTKALLVGWGLYALTALGWFAYSSNSLEWMCLTR